MSIEIGDYAPWIQYTANTGDVNFQTIFPFYNKTDVLVFKRIAGASPNDNTDQRTYATHFTVEGEGLATGGYITLLTASVAGDIVTVVRDQPVDRSNTYASNTVSTEGLNANFSRNVLMIQQNEYIGKTLSPRYDYSATPGVGDAIMDLLPAGYAWRKSAAGDRIEAFLPTSSSTPVTDSVVAMDVTQAGHGLVVGNVVRVDGVGDYVPSQANNVANAEVIGYVSVVISVDEFTLQTDGNITTGLAGLTPSHYQYLDPTTPGAITNIRPTTAGQIVKPVMQATSATTAAWKDYLGALL